MESTRNFFLFLFAFSSHWTTSRCSLRNDLADLRRAQMCIASLSNCSIRVSRFCQRHKNHILHDFDVECTHGRWKPGLPSSLRLSA
ncbi:hypothetical protein F5879DRAFT_93948 [Lentinula edodes]|nr:hypothetical protein F5879DRAFT_93948 [Lentinula edodes]